MSKRRKTRRNPQTKGSHFDRYRPENAARAFRRAVRASRLAKIACRGARHLYACKIESLATAVRIAPYLFLITIDDHRHIGLPAIEFIPTGRRLHLRWDDLVRVAHSFHPSA